MRALCLSAGAWSRFGDVGLVDGRGAGIHAVGIRAGIAADAGSTPTGTRGFAVVGGGRVAALLEIALRTRPMLFYQKISTLPQAPFGRISIFFSDYAALKSA